MMIGVMRIMGTNFLLFVMSPNNGILAGCSVYLNSPFYVYFFYVFTKNNHGEKMFLLQYKI